MPDSKAKSIASKMTCKEIFAFLSEYVDGELSEELCEAIQTHNGNCPPCQAFVDTFITTIELVKKQPAKPLPPAVKDELNAALNRCREALDQAR
ncbi:MAG: hypothetical protein CMH81_02070 [Nitrospiraceae bacterium]|nr:hypothetical protein [Nitrospiraceae bacterium]|tara:strand:+ start:395 stop:676 length:282 start_codon:yes stop_codon:yes gene_type:complete